MATLVFEESNGRFKILAFFQGGFQKQFAGPLHAGITHIEFLVEPFFDQAHTGVAVSSGNVIKQTDNPGQNGGAQIAMQGRHGTFLDMAGQTGTKNEIGIQAQ